MRRYVVGSQPEKLEVALRTFGENARIAVDEGRVFVGKKRVTDAGLVLGPGTEVRVAPARADAAKASIAEVVLFEDDDFVSVAKAHGIVTVPSLEGSKDSLVARVARARAKSIDDLIVTSRLDRDVSGVVTFAKNVVAAKRVSDAREAGALHRRYVALAQGAPGAAAGEWNAPIGRHAKPLLRAAFGPEGKDARSRYAVASRANDVTLLALAPVTGRTHQLRIHASHAGAPLLGDRDYGGPSRLVLASGRVIAIGRIALHCAAVTLPLAGGRTERVVAPIPAELRAIWLALGGEPEAWDRAVTCAV